jgi:hypothetical protein
MVSNSTGNAVRLRRMILDQSLGHTTEFDFIVAITPVIGARYDSLYSTRCRPHKKYMQRYVPLAGDV